MDYGNLYSSIFQAAASSGGAQNNFYAFKTPNMNAIDSVFSGVNSALSSVYGNMVTKFLQPGVWNNAMRNHLTGAEREQNAFNAQQAQLQRDFQQSLFNQGVELENSSFQRQVSDMKSAGVNPAIMYGGAGSSGAGTPSAGSGAAASGSASAPADINSLTQLLYAGAQIRALDAQTNLTEAQTSKVRSEEEGIDIDNQYKPAYWSQQISNMLALERNLDAETALARQRVRSEVGQTIINRYKATEAQANASISLYEQSMKALEANYKDKFLDLQLKGLQAAKNKDEAEANLAREQSSALYFVSICKAAESNYFSAAERKLLAEAGLTEDVTKEIVRSYELNNDIADVQKAMKEFEQKVQAINFFVSMGKDLVTTGTQVYNAGTMRKGIQYKDARSSMSLINNIDPSGLGTYMSPF